MVVTADCFNCLLKQHAVFNLVSDLVTLWVNVGVLNDGIDEINNTCTILVIVVSEESQTNRSELRIWEIKSLENL
jgi:hypothetical protein